MYKLILFSTFFFSQISEAQIVNIPDPIFKEYLLSVQNLDSNSDGEIQVEEAEQPGIFQLNVRGLGITNLTGIEAFKNLKLFDCSENPLTDVDFSENIELFNLSISNCEIDSIDLSTLDKLSSFNAQNCNLSEIDLSLNIDLSSLTLTANNLSELDVSNNSNLRILRAASNNLSQINLTNNLALDRINLSINIFEEIDLSNQNLVSELILHTNQLSELNLIHMVELVNLSCQNNNLDFLNIDNSDSLIIMSASQNNLTELNLSNKPNLIRVSFANNFISELDLNESQKLEWLKFENNLMKEIDVSNHPKLTLFESSNNMFTVLDLTSTDSLTSFTASGPNLRFINLANGANEDLNFMMTSGEVLDCIKLDDGFDFDNVGVTWSKPPQTIYTYDCCLSSESSFIDTLCYGSSYILPSGTQEITESGVYLDTIRNSFTCDSLITINLEFNQVNTEIEVIDSTIYAQENDATSYQWIDCSTLEIIPGATDFNYSPIESGSYALIIDISTCVDTTECAMIDIISSINPNIEHAKIEVFPNPTSDYLNIKLDTKAAELMIIVSDFTGKYISQKKVENSDFLKLEMPQAKGIYYLQIFDQHRLLAIKKIYHL